MLNAFMNYFAEYYDLDGEGHAITTTAGLNPNYSTSNEIAECPGTTRWRGRKVCFFDRIIFSRMTATTSICSNREYDTPPPIRGASPTWKSIATLLSKANSPCAAQRASCPTEPRSICPADSPLPPPIVVPETASQQVAWLSMPVAAANTREFDERESESAARFITGSETFIDSSSALRIEEEIDIAYPRLGYELRKTAKPGYIGLGVAPHPGESETSKLYSTKNSYRRSFICRAHPVVDGWIDQSGWLDRQQARRTRALCSRPHRRRRPSKRRLFRLATPEPPHRGS